MRLPAKLLIVVASLLWAIALFGAWADRQLLDTDEWTQVNAQLLRSDDVRGLIVDVITDDVADGSRVTAALQEELPPRLQPLAGAAGAATREAVRRIADRALASGRLQSVWVEANRITHQQFVNLVKGEGVEVAGRGVVLDLRPLAVKVAQQAGLSGERIQRLPDRRGRIVIMQADQLDALQKAAKLLAALPWVAGVLALLLSALAIFLAHGARPRAIAAAGIGLAGAALLVLALRRIGGQEVVSALTKNGPAEPAAQDVWEIETSLLRDIGAAALLLGVLAALGGWLAGAGERAGRVRARLAPLVAGRLGTTIAVVFALYLALIAWGPLSVFRGIVPALIFAALLLAGVVALHAQLRRESTTGP